MITNSLGISCSLFVSLALHSLVLLFIFWPGEHTNPTTSHKSRIEIKVVENSHSSHHQLQRKNRSEAKMGGPKLKVLSPSGQLLPMLLPQWNQDSSTTRESWENGGTGEIKRFGFKSGSLDKLRDFNVYDKVYQKIDSQLIYPQILAQKDIQGTVIVQTRLLPGGRFDWQNMKIRGASVYLRAYILRVLNSLFKNEEDHLDFRSIKEPLPLDLSFSFTTTDSSEKEKKHHDSFIVGHVLSFVRYKYKPKPVIKIGPLSMLIIPNFAYVSLDIAQLLSELKGSDVDQELKKYLTESDIKD